MSAKQPKERVLLSGPQYLPGTQTLVADNAGPRIWRAYHETFTVCVITGLRSGPIEWVYRGKTYSLDAGGVMLMEPGETHSNTKPVPCVSFRVLLVASSIVEKTVANLGGRATGVHFKIAQTFDLNLFRAFRDLHCSIENDASMLEQQSRFAGCLQLLAQQCMECSLARVPAVHSAAVHKTKEYLRETFRRDVSLDELTRVAGVSRFHLLRSFKQEVGIPPHAFQIQLRLSAARESLRRGLSIADSAADSGFSDQSHFTRLFREFWGVTPKMFSDSVRPKPLLFPSKLGG